MPTTALFRAGSRARTVRSLLPGPFVNVARCGHVNYGDVNSATMVADPQHHLYVDGYDTGPLSGKHDYELHGAELNPAPQLPVYLFAVRPGGSAEAQRRPDSSQLRRRSRRGRRGVVAGPFSLTNVRHASSEGALARSPLGRRGWPISATAVVIAEHDQRNIAESMCISQ